jgi:hypothetical protein
MAELNQANAQSPYGTVRLRHTLGLWSLAIIGMVTVQPTAPMGTYGVISNKGHGHVVTTVLLAMIAMLFNRGSYEWRPVSLAGRIARTVSPPISPALRFLRMKPRTPQCRDCGGAASLVQGTASAAK